ncbi:MAG: manganese efflux pump MntP family protein [Coriobacteriia bacterium]|jgi:putative Mn2+ efflux pump MntP|nr:manganese efflux pump MntP family protein [Coriobacteriia bacterium]MDR2714754.1 manganese efflux pump MntP family protein [Coriobacteriales bacterium]
MDYLALSLIALGLAMDAFTVTICNGMAIKEVRLKHALAFGFMFGGLQMLMTIIGSFMGSSFTGFIESIEHWVAFILLAAIGGKKLYDAFRDKSTKASASEHGIAIGTLFFLGIATSIDALAVGISIALTGWNIWGAAVIFGVVTFAFAFFGILIGKRFGKRFEKIAAAAGGIILIIIALRIPIEPLLIQLFEQIF